MKNWKLIMLAMLSPCLGSCESLRETFDREGSREAYMQILKDAAFKAGAQAAFDAMQPRDGSK